MNIVQILAGFVGLIILWWNGFFPFGMIFVLAAIALIVIAIYQIPEEYRAVRNLAFVVLALAILPNFGRSVLRNSFPQTHEAVEKSHADADLRLAKALTPTDFEQRQMIFDFCKQVEIWHATRLSERINAFTATAGVSTGDRVAKVLRELEHMGGKLPDKLLAVVSSTDDLGELHRRCAMAVHQLNTSGGGGVFDLPGFAVPPISPTVLTSVILSVIVMGIALGLIQSRGFRIAMAVAAFFVGYFYLAHLYRTQTAVYAPSMAAAYYRSVSTR